MKFRSADSMVRDICALGFQDDNATQYLRVMRAFRVVLEQLNLHLLPNFKSEWKTVSDALTIEMPSECLSINKVGWLCDGRIALLGRDDSIRRDIAPPCSCGGGVSTVEDSCAACTFHNVVVGYGNLAYGEQYGVRTNLNPRGTFRYNRDKNRIEFGSENVSAGDSLLVEYKAAGVADIHAQIPSDAFMCIFHKTLSVMNANVRPGVADYNHQKFRMEWNMWKRTFMEWSVDDWANALRGESMAAPKY